jgi:hypothetical protein
MRKNLFGVVASFAVMAVGSLMLACSAPAKVGQFAAVAVVYINGQAAESRLLEITPTLASCRADIEKLINGIGAPPAGMSAEFSCVELAPFIKVNPSAKPTLPTT